MHLDDLPETAPIPTLPPTFYDSPALKHLRQGALSKRTAPDAVLHSVLARLSAFTAADLVLPGINGPESPLNYFVAVIAPSGGGKSTGAGIARMLLPAPEHLWDRDDIPVGTGEGLIESCFEKDPDTKQKVQEHHNLFLYVDEGEVFKRLGARDGTTLDTVIRSAFSGGVLGQRNAHRDTSRMLPPRSYSIGMVVGYQPEHAGHLLGQVGGGTPQRFVWASAGPGPDVRPEVRAARKKGWPGALQIRPYWDRTGEIEFPSSVRTVIEERSEEIWFGDRIIDPFDAHATLIAMRQAALLALLHGRIKVTESDWRHSATLLKTSTLVRGWVRKQVQAQEESEHRKTLQRDADRARIQAVARDDRKDYQQFVEQRVVQILQRHGDDGLAVGRFQAILTAGQMSVLPHAIKELTARKEIELVPGTKRLRWIDPAEVTIELTL